MAGISDTDRPQGIVARHFTGSITRSTTSNAVLFTLPPMPTILSWKITGTVASDAGTTARISLGCNAAERVFLSEFNVKTNGGLQSFPSSATHGLISDPNPIPVIARYDEDGDASTTGGPWTVDVTVI